MEDNNQYVLPDLFGVEIYLIDDNDTSTPAGTQYNYKTGKDEYIHPNADLFKWIETDISQNQWKEISERIISKTKPDKKGVIAIYQDKKIKEFSNAPNDFIPHLKNKNQLGT